MKRLAFLLAAASLLSTGLAPVATASEDENPHRLAPRGVTLSIEDGALLRAPNEEWFEAQAEVDPGRFTWNDEAADVTEDGVGIGDFEGGWVDAEGEYVFLYDEEEDEFAYWQNIDADTLTRGRRGFVQFCASCHGLDGNGYGRSAQHLRPPPRDFRQSNYKFTKVIGDLPTDEALIRLVKRGLDGTPMYPWALSDGQLYDIVQYVKSLSPEGEGWRDVYAEVGEVVESGEDPWIGREDEAYRRGEEIYHGKAQCHGCHPGYVTPLRMAEIRGDAPGTAYREDLTYPVLKESSYQVLGEDVQFLPPDFTWHTTRSGTTPLDLYETIATGIKGTAMPQWKGSLPDEDIWAMAYYVQALIDQYYGDPAKRAAFMAGLRQGN